MADNKKYYYIRLKDNFFNTNELVLLESMPDGYLYSNILLKLYLLSLKDNGKLMFNNRIPYNTNMIATITKHQVGTVEKALKIFQDMGLIEVLDNGAIYMLDIQQYIGKSSTEADRIKKYRKQIEVDNTKSVQMYNKRTPEIEIELEIEKEINKECIASSKATPTPQKQKYGKYNNVLLSEDEKRKLDKDFGNTEELIEFLDEYIEMKGYKVKSHYLAIKKWVVSAVDERKKKNKQLSRVAPTYTEAPEPTKTRDELLEELKNSLN